MPSTVSPRHVSTCISKSNGAARRGGTRRIGFLSSGCLLSWVLLIFDGLSPPLAASQRIKTGCYDANPGAFTSCNDAESTPTQQEYITLSQQFNVEGVCHQIITEVFPAAENKVVWNARLHPEYLNGVDSNTEFCKQMQLAYRHCLFCASYWTIRFDCQHDAGYVQCGGKPSREEILAFAAEGDEIYSRFPTEAAIDETCADLERAYEGDSWVQELDYPVPTTLDLCERQRLVKHVCPGFCEGDCFDATEYPPTCDPDAYQGPVNPTLDAFVVCDEVGFQSFLNADIGEIMGNVTHHLDYMKFLYKEDPLCNQIKQVYHDCYWCSTDRCFGDHHPTSCEPTYVDPNIDVQDACRELLYAFDNVAFEDELNVSAHKFLVPDNIPACDTFRQIYHLCFWCAPADITPFDFCLPNTSCNSTMPMPDYFVSTTLTALGIETTPEMIQATNDLELIEMQLDCMALYEQWQKNWSDPFSLQACYEDIFLARLCPIEVCQAEPPRKKLGQKYLGATTLQQKRALIWVSRVSSILSFFGASYIIYDSLKDGSARSMTYNQLLIGMAVFDIVTAFAWVFATTPIVEDEAGHVEGSIGNERTCKAQAFFIQLGFTSIFYNVSLALYYALVIAYDWREFHLKQVRKYMLSLPVIVGLGLAIGVLFKSHWIEYGCHILPPPEGEMWAALVFVVLPLGFSIASITTCMLMIFFQVHERAEKSKKWSIGIGQASRVEQAVFWQCLFYVCAFYITWPVLFSVYLASIDVNGPLGLTILVAYCAPIQGFHNALVYIRPKILRKREERKENSNSERRGSSSKFSSSLLGMMKGMVGAKSSQQMSVSELPNHAQESKDMGSTIKLDPSVALALQRETKKEHGATRLFSKDFHPFTPNEFKLPLEEVDEVPTKRRPPSRRGSSRRHSATENGEEPEYGEDRRTSLGPFDIVVGELRELEHLAGSDSEDEGPTGTEERA